MTMNVERFIISEENGHRAQFKYGATVIYSSTLFRKRDEAVEDLNLSDPDYYLAQAIANGSVAT